jgi:hypothetical protein
MTTTLTTLKKNAKRKMLMTMEQEQDQTIQSKTAQRFANLWTLFYRHGMNACVSKNFYHDGDLNSAISRARHHCQVMNYRYIFVKPLIVNIETEEDYILKGGTSEPPG